MKILYLNHYAGSPAHGMEFRPFYLAREWVRQGHEVRLVAADKSHIRSAGPVLGSLDHLDEVIDGVQYTWLATRNYSGNGVSRVLNMMSFVWSLYRNAERFVNEFKPDVVIASSTYPMDMFAARRISKIAGAKLVFEVHDLWPLSPMELGNMSKWHPFIMLVQAGEDYAYRHADVVVSMLPKVHEYMQSRGLDLRKLHVVPNGISPDEWQGSAQLDSPIALEALRGFKARGAFIVGYAGTHGVSNALGTLLDAAMAMKDDANVVFVLFGMGPEKPRLQARADAEGLSNVFFFDSVPKAQVPALLDFFDIAYIGWNHQPLYRFGIAPNKLMDYMMAGKVVLHSVEAGNDSVGEAGCGLTVQPENAFEIVKGIQKLRALSLEQRKAMGGKGREFVMRNHTYPVLAKKFMSAFS